MPTRQFDVVPRKTDPPSYQPENNLASFKRLEIQPSFMFPDITFIIMNICIQGKLRHVFHVLII